jgi:uncharacterized membrane protein
MECKVFRPSFRTNYVGPSAVEGLRLTWRHSLRVSRFQTTLRRAAIHKAGNVRAAFILSFLANVLLSLASLAILPEHVAVHFGLGGAPDGWASSQVSTLMMLGMHTLLFVGLSLSPNRLAKVPSKWISLPNRDYWLAPERRAQTMERLSRSMWHFGTALFLFMFFIGLLTIRANLSDPVRLDERSLLIALGVFLAYTAFWTVALLRAFRVSQSR